MTQSDLMSARNFLAEVKLRIVVIRRSHLLDAPLPGYYGRKVIESFDELEKHIMTCCHAIDHLEV